MTRRLLMSLGFLSGGLAALVGLLIFLTLRGGGDHDADMGATSAAQTTPAQGRATGPTDAGSSADQLSDSAPGAEAQMRPIAIYQRAAGDAFTLQPITGQIVWFGTPVERARQIARLVLEGFPEVPGVVPAAPAGARLRDVLIDDDGVAWVDLDGASINKLAGEDAAMSLVAALARSLTEALPEVRRVGIVVDGQPREELGGLVDLTRTYTGREWDATAGDRDAEPPPDQPAPDATPDATSAGTEI